MHRYAKCVDIRPPVELPTRGQEFRRCVARVAPSARVDVPEAGRSAVQHREPCPRQHRPPGASLDEHIPRSDIEMQRTARMKMSEALGDVEEELRELTRHIRVAQVGGEPWRRDVPAKGRPARTPSLGGNEKGSAERTALTECDAELRQARPIDEFRHMA